MGMVILPVPPPPHNSPPPLPTLRAALIPFSRANQGPSIPGLCRVHAAFWIAFRGLVKGVDLLVGCRMSEERVPLGPPVLRADCEDSPSDWQDTEGRSCADYAAEQLCTPDGQYGANWSRYWGTFADYAVHGVAAPQACCGCGKAGIVASWGGSFVHGICVSVRLHSGCGCGRGG